MSISKESILKVASMAVVTLGLIFFAHNMTEDKNMALYDFCMGTSASVHINGEASGDKLAREIIDEIKKLDSEIISWRTEDSELSRLNKGYKAGETYYVSEELRYAIEESLRLCEDSGGAVDITLRPVLGLWGIEDKSEEDFEPPAEDELRELKDIIGYENVHVSLDGVTVDKADMILDFGATGKGYALDIAKKRLEEAHAKSALVSVGGSILIYGNKENDTPWRVGIRNPKGTQEDMLGYLEMQGEDGICISTSGDYEKYIEKDGIRYHHIIDRRYLAPAKTDITGLAGVTVVCRSGIDSDGLSTACFVLGEKASRDLLKKYDAEAIFIDRDNNISMTDGLKDYFKYQK